ncbi:MAG: hypothetical protein U5N56_04260 [Candidatus Marinimicrobia bacterium]|nr:hypothetical protein [Candidatus Neomarinimicrobiota bacterium]
MKISTRILMITILLAGSLLGRGLMQQNNHPNPGYYKYMVFRMTEELELTEKEAEKFFPLHRSYQNNKYQYHRELAALSEKAYERENVNDEDLQYYKEEIKRLKQEELNLDMKFYSELEDFLSAEKVLRYIFFEHHFRREMSRELKKRYQGSTDDKGRSKGFWPKTKK